MGTRIEAPSNPGPDAPLEERMDYLRAWHEYRQQITNAHNEAFDRAFRAELKRAAGGGTAAGELLNPHKEAP